MTIDVRSNARRARFAMLAALAFAVALPAGAQSCAGFSDVAAASPFCPNVEWIRNRGVTLGCTATTYCPNDPVTRLQMAAFMNRLGTALTPIVHNVAAVSAALVLDATPVVCQTTDQAIASFPRRALVDASLAGTGPSGVDIGVRAVYSTNGGASWAAVGTVMPAAYVAPGQWGGVADVGALDLEVGQSVRFGVQVARVGAGSANLADSRCQLRAAVSSRDGATSPY